MKKTIQLKTHKIDADGQVLGRLSTKIADLLRGKGKVEFVPNVNVGDKVVVVNVSKIVMTGRKIDSKQFARHSGYLGHLKFTSLKELFKNKPEEVLKRAVKGMLPKNKLRNGWMKNLTIYRGENNDW